MTITSILSLVRLAGSTSLASLMIALLTVTGCAPPATTGEPDVAPAEQPPEVEQHDWSRWRGPNGQGVSEAANLPAVWSEGSPNVRWKTWTPGAGNSSPIASRGRVFLATTYGSPEDDWGQARARAEVHRAIVALDLQSGELLWQTPIFYGPEGKLHETNTSAASTPVTDGRRVFASFDGILAALDVDGRILWQHDVDPDYMRFSHYGASTSPMLAGDAVILMQDREEGESPDVGWIAAFSKETGEQLWRDEWSHTCCSYTTPILLDRGDGILELASSTSQEFVSYDPRTGARLWTAAHQSIQPVPSLLTSGDYVSAPGGIHGRGLVVYRLTGHGAETETEMLWYTRDSIPKIPTPLFYGDRLFVLTEDRRLTAFVPETGRRLWRGRPAHGTYWPSLIAGDGKLYATNQYGVVSVIATDADEYQLIAENAVDGEIMGATPAIAGGCLLLRARNHLYCIEKERPAASTATPTS